MTVKKIRGEREIERKNLPVIGFHDPRRPRWLYTDHTAFLQSKTRTETHRHQHKHTGAVPRRLATHTHTNRKTLEWHTAVSSHSSLSSGLHVTPLCTSGNGEALHSFTRSSWNHNLVQWKNTHWRLSQEPLLPVIFSLSHWVTAGRARRCPNAQKVKVTTAQLPGSNPVSWSLHEELRDETVLQHRTQISWRIIEVVI